MEYQVQIGERKIEIEKNNDATLVDGEKSTFRIEMLGDRYLVYSDQTISEVIVISKSKHRVKLLINGKEADVSVKDHVALMLDQLGMSATVAEVANEVLAPMPGVILSIMVTEGQKVTKGEPLLILEAMKMENLIKAPADATIKEIEVSKGQNVEKNTPLIRFEF